ncbi:ABC transporter ATP-binding protein [Candidatus Lariskella endosymbiont of Hedychridium roseum]|uniref:ABC transporter ATP-binding protein n=1 Tax=Candidatus Lariskella endosymbiont of Hedychridium roseum TaxID=3077949 RepID=UPI0030CF4C67
MVDREKILPKTLFPFIWYFLREYQSIVMVFVLLVFAAGFWGPFNSILVKHVINLLPQVSDGDVSILYLPASLIVLNFIVFDNFTWRGVGYISYKYRGVIKTKIVKTIFEHVIDGSHQFFQDNLAGRLSNQITTLADSIEMILHRISVDFIRGTSLLLMSFAASFSVNPTFCYILLVWFICFSSFSVWMSKRLITLADCHAASESSVSGQLVDAISNHASIRIFSRKVFELARMDDFFRKVLKTSRQKEGFIVILHTTQGAMIAAMMCFSVYFLIYFYKLGIVSVGDFSLILGLFMELGHMMWYTMSRVDDFNQAYGKCKQSLSALIMLLEIQDKPNASILKCNRGQIIFDNVKFNYKGNETLFQNKSVEILQGQKVGLVGYSGSGKSTFVNLILRLYDVIDGAILIDGHDVRDITQESLRTSIAMIPQDPSLFHRSVMDNIRYGLIDATDKQVIKAAKKAHAHEFIIKLPQGYNSLVGERGVRLSGGQRQRIAIARAILKNAPILILDEATSQLDSVTESFIQESLLELMKDKTTIVIAHRLSTLLCMDRILVFDRGRIIEDGAHNKLLAKNGLYRQLWNAQVGGFLGDEKYED